MQRLKVADPLRLVQKLGTDLLVSTIKLVRNHCAYLLLEDDYQMFCAGLY